MRTVVICSWLSTARISPGATRSSSPAGSNAASRSYTSRSWPSRYVSRAVSYRTACHDPRLYCRLHSVVHFLRMSPTDQRLLSKTGSD